MEPPSKTGGSSQGGSSPRGRQRLLDVLQTSGEVEAPEAPFVLHRDEARAFMHEHYISRKITTFSSTGRTWGYLLGPGVGTWLMSIAWCGAPATCSSGGQSRNFAPRRMI